MKGSLSNKGPSASFIDSHSRCVAIVSPVCGGGLVCKRTTLGVETQSFLLCFGETFRGCVPFVDHKAVLLCPLRFGSDKRVTWAANHKDIGRVGDAATTAPSLNLVWVIHCASALTHTA